MSTAAFGLTSTLKRTINRAADGLVPLAAWVSSKSYAPAQTVPWRNGECLTAERLLFADFLEVILRETSWDADMKSKWDEFAETPLDRCPIARVQEWRANRGLSPEPMFAITLSDAVLADLETREISRMEFYKPYWPLLSDAYDAADVAAKAEGKTIDEAAFAADLMADKNAYWPQAGQWRSSRFAKQFVKDILYCYLGLRGLASAPWTEAVLLELGEGRRVGNRYGSADAEAAVKRFNEVLGDLRVQGGAHPLVEAERAHMVQPVGSPPVNARDL